MADGSPWTDPLDDMSGVYTPPGGLVGVEVTGGEVRLLPGHDEGWIASDVISCPSSFRYDLVLLEASVPGNSSLQVSILDPTSPPADGSHANATLPGLANVSGTDVSLTRLDEEAFPIIRIQVRLVADGNDCPSLKAWTVLFGDPGEWRDDFLGTGKMRDERGINLTSRAVEVDLSRKPSDRYGNYERYPTFLISNGRISNSLSAIYPDSARTKYETVSSVPCNATLGLAIGDLDQDGNLDLVCGNNIDSQGSTQDHEILWGKAGDRWSHSGVTKLKSCSARDVALGDFNGDGWLDIVTSFYDGDDGHVYVFLNDGKGGFSYNPDIMIDSKSGSYWHATTGDLNSDGYDDLILPRHQNDSCDIHLGGPNGPSTTPDVSLGRGWFSGGVLCQDLDMDGHLDLLFGNSSGAMLFLGGTSGPDGIMDHSLLTGGTTVDVDAGDLNGDGYNDLVLYSTRPTIFQVNIFEGGPDGWSNESVKKITTEGVGQTSVIDVDKDGYDDICLGVKTRFKVYKGGPNYDLSPDITMTKTGTDPGVWDIMPVAETGGSIISGTFTTEMIRRPADKRWDILDLKGSFPANTSSVIMVLDGGGNPVSGYTGVPQRNLDLSGLTDIDAIRVKVDLSCNLNTSTPIVDRLIVNWMSRWEWREQYYGAAKIDSLQGLELGDEELRRAQDVGGPEDGLYLSQSFGPEVTRDADRFHTFRYTARLGMSQSGTVRLVDTVTSEVMAQTPLRSGTHDWDLTGKFDLRDHPSIRLNITAGGLGVAGEFVLDDLWVNWTPRSNQPPTVVDMWPGETTVERTETVDLYVNVSDDYDDIRNLTVEVEHSLQGSGVWSSNLFHPTKEAIYEGDLWVFYLNPPSNAELGNYTFRVNVTDLDNDHTGFIEYPPLLEVLPGLPSIPTNLVVTAMDSAVELEWRSPRDIGDSPILGYRIFRGTSNDSLELISTVEPSNITYLDGTVENGVTYFYAVLAFTANGNGELSEIIEVRPVGKPTAPLDLVAQMNEGQVILTWKAPESDGGHPVLDYYLYKGYTENLLTWEVTVTGTEYTYTGLTKGEDYYFAVSARNLLGEGPTSSVVSATFVSLPSAPRDLNANGGILKVSLTWHSPNDNGGLGISGFVIYRGVTSGSLEELKTIGSASSLYTDEDVEGGVTYHYSVAAMNSLGEGPMCEAVPAMPIGPPVAPGGLEAIEGDGQVTLIWTAPEKDGGSPVMGYVIMRGSSPDDLTRLSQVMDQLTYVDDEGTNGETYHYAVAAINDVGEGLLSAIAEATPFRIPTVPGTVRLLTGKAKDGKVELNWATPEDDGGSALTGYVVLRGSSADDMEVVATLGVVTSWTDEDAKRGRTYLYSVAALNEHGKGEPINEVEVKVPKKEENPGFVIIAALIALMLTGFLLGRRR